MKQKDLVLLPYPFTDLEKAKIRPGLVISKDSLNSKSNDLIILPLTTILKNNPYSLLITQLDLSSGELIKSSWVRIDKVFTVEKRLVKKVIGKLNKNSFDKIKEEFFKVF